MDININDYYNIEFATSDGKVTVKRCGIYGLKMLFIDGIPTLTINENTLQELEYICNSDLVAGDTDTYNRDKEIMDIVKMYID